MVSYFSAGTQWATAEGNPKGIDPENPCGKTIAVQTDTVQDTDDLPVRQKKCGGDQIKVLRYGGQDQATNAVVTGKADAMLADSPVVAYAVKQSGGKLEPLGDIYEAAPYGYVVPKAETEFADAIVEALKAIEGRRRVRGGAEEVGGRAGRHLRLRRQPVTATATAPAPVSDERPGMIEADAGPPPRALGGHRGARRAGADVPQPADQQPGVQLAVRLRGDEPDTGDRGLLEGHHPGHGPGDDLRRGARRRARGDAAVGQPGAARGVLALHLVLPGHPALRAADHHGRARGAVPGGARRSACRSTGSSSTGSG